MRFQFTVFALIAVAQAISITDAPDDKAVEAASHAKELIDSANTSDDFKAISHPFQTIEASVDTKITGERHHVEDAVGKV